MSSSRREQLLDAADVVVRRSGSTASMNDIAAEAGITKPILYRHFGDKSGLYRALADRYTHILAERLVAALGTHGGLQARTRATIDTYLSSIEEQPQIYRFLMERAVFEAPGVAGEVAGFVRRFGDMLATGLLNEPELTGIAKVRAAVWAQAIAGMVQQTGDWWLDHAEVPRSKVSSELTRLLVAGFAVDSASPAVVGRG